MPTINREAVMTELRRFLEKMPTLMLKAAKRAMGPAVDSIWENIPEYPLKPEGSTYRRTGILGAGYTESVQSTDNTVTGALGPTAPYAPWVVGPDYPGQDLGGGLQYQAKVHKGRWYQLQDVFDSNVDGAWLRFNEGFEKELGNLIKEER